MTIIYDISKKRINKTNRSLVSIDFLYGKTSSQLAFFITVDNGY